MVKALFKRALLVVASFGVFFCLYSGWASHPADAAPPSRIVFISATKIISAGTASSAITIQTQDNKGNPTSVNNTTLVTLTSTSLSGRFDILANGAFDGRVTSVPIANGGNSANFFYKDTTSGKPTINAASSGFSNASQQETILAGVATQVRVETAGNGSGTVVPSQSLLAGSSLTVYGVTRDQYNNFVANPASVTWSLINKAGGVADADLSATSGASVTLTGHLAGTAVIHAANSVLIKGDSGAINVVLPGGSSGGGGVGGGFFGGGIAAPAPTPGITDVRQKANNSGVFYVDTYAPSQDGKVMLKIDASTRGLNKDGMSLTEISILPNPNLPAPPAAGQVMVLLYDFTPAGATFTNPVTITMTYDPSQLPVGSTESGLYFVWFNAANNMWVPLPSTLDTVNKKVTALITHFSFFGLFATVSQPTQTLPPVIVQTAAPTQTPTLKPASFLVSELYITPTEVSSNQVVKLNITTLNNGDVSGSFDIKVMINNSLYTTRTITIPGNSSDSSTVSLNAGPAGDYSVSIGSRKGSFTVKASPTPTATALVVLSPTITPTQPTPATLAPAVESKGGLPVLWITFWICFFLFVSALVIILIIKPRPDNHHPAHSTTQK
jgi:hypothetical protein